jgi:two-component system chemotaxis response regulator CheB
MNIKVLVVDDSAFMRKVISDMIASSEDMTVVGTAKNGKEAIEMVKVLHPDVVTLDVEMPIMDGLSALKHLVAENPIPVIMLSSLTQQGTHETLKALDYGAVDFVPKPSSLLKVSAPELKDELLMKIRIASRTKVRPSSPPVPVQKPIEKPVSTVKSIVKAEQGSARFKKIIAIGTSTGGPRALQDVIPLIPEDIDASIVVVQHMPPGFTKSLAERLNALSHVHVKEAEQGDVLKAGWAYIAPGDSHLKVTKHNGQFVIELDNGERVTGHKPSVDAMMYSIADLHDPNVIGVIMTGMGADGAEGMKKLKEQNGYVIAQDEESCVVYGMPKSAVKLGAVDKVVSLSNIANEIVKAMEV